PVKGFASHGESWSIALSLKLASYELLKSDGDNPILILDDVFSELDQSRRDRLAKLTSTSDQTFITVAVANDLPNEIVGKRYEVLNGQVIKL
ncbi:MAG: DNA replication and repair protein RecF, partial [Actinomycetota bacterium]